VRTMHVSKGLEYPVVFVPDAWEVSSARSRELELYRDGGWCAAFGDARTEPRVVESVTRGRLEESQRLAYVALTRARQCCYVAIAATTTQKERGAIGWLLRPHDADDTGGGAAEYQSVLRVLDGLVAASSGAMAVMPAEPSAAVRAVPSGPAPVLTSAPIDRARDWRSWTVFSYSAVTASDQGPGLPVPCADTPTADLDLLPPGAGSGIALHALFEELPFNVGSDGRRTAIARLIDRYALTSLLNRDDSARLVNALGAMTDAVLDSPVPGLDLTLSQLDSARMLREWRFDLAVSRLDSRALVNAFRECGGDESRYADHLERLGDGPRRGFLTGVMDLVAEHDGRWYLIDWKSNHLGRSRGGFGAEAMRAEMMECHYVLQYHLYLVALDRYLRLRLPRWDRRSMLGGVIYPFLRGIALDSPDGWHVVRPGEDLLDSVAAAVAY
jgi:exodeoxyribonuclease V beta subunit